MRKKIRELYFYKDYFRDFYSTLSPKAQKKVLWVLKIVEETDRIPETYFKFLQCSDGIYEIRVRCGNNIYRIFCFFEENHIVVVANGFHKKSQKTPVEDLERAKRIKQAYYEEKQTSHLARSVH